MALTNRGTGAETSSQKLQRLHFWCSFKTNAKCASKLAAWRGMRTCCSLFLAPVYLQQCRDAPLRAVRDCKRTKGSIQDKNICPGAILKALTVGENVLGASRHASQQSWLPISSHQQDPASFAKATRASSGTNVPCANVRTAGDTFRAGGTLQAQVPQEVRALGAAENRWQVLSALSSRLGAP